jgi:hypothetical protein
MRLINKNSKRGVVNLLSDFILSKIDKTEKSIIQVTDCGTFMVINGLTTSKEVLNLSTIKEEFKTQFSDILESLDIPEINVIDIIKYDQDINPISKGWVTLNKGLYIEEPEPLNELSTSSEFPYGHSLDCGRLMVYYSNYILNHMFNLLSVDEVSFYHTNELDDSEDLKIKIVSDSKIDKNKIKSLILDVFDFDMGSFRNRLDDYNLIDDILYPLNEKPYLKQDMLEHVILF